MTRTKEGTASTSDSVSRPELARRITLPLLIFYGVGVTVGAGIYVLIGEAVSRAGINVPVAFVAASILVAFSAASYAELSSRFPVSAGEAAYVRAGLGSKLLSTAAGLFICVAGTVSSAALVRGGAGYIGELASVPQTPVMAVLTIALGVVAAWGISQSVIAAAVFTCLEVGGLLLIVGAGLGDPALIISTATAAFSIPDVSSLVGVSSAALLAFFAFIGFEDIVNVAEETIDPESTLPRAIFATLAITTTLYVLVALVSISHVPIAELAASKAPIALVFEYTLGASGKLIAVIAVSAVINGVLIQVIMVSRILYGMSRMGQLPAVLGTVNKTTHTPLFATACVSAAILVLCLTVDVAVLAEIVSSVTLVVFALVNLSLWRLRATAGSTHLGFSVPRWVPLLGFVISVTFLAGEFGRRLF